MIPSRRWWQQTNSLALALVSALASESALALALALASALASTLIKPLTIDELKALYGGLGTHVHLSGLLSYAIGGGSSASYTSKKLIVMLP